MTNEISEIIKIKQECGASTINARDLYKWLEIKSDFNNWIKNYIKDFDFIENKDFVIIYEKSAGRPIKEYHISIDMAKELSMLSRSEKGKLARKYFIDCEKKLKETQNVLQIPQNFSEALKLAYEQSLEIEQQKLQITQDKPKVEFYDTVVDSMDAIEMGEVAKVLNLGIGRNISKCNHCGLCEDVCPMGVRILSDPPEKVRNPLCTNCLDCVAVCPEDALEIKFL